MGEGLELTSAHAKQVKPLLARRGAIHFGKVWIKPKPKPDPNIPNPSP